MPKVYRVEHKKDRVGPYISENFGGCPEDYALAAYFMDKHQHCECHPSPYLDGLFTKYTSDMDFVAEHVFGFDSVESLKKWFGSAGRILEACGYVITVYRVDEKHIRRGNYQRFLDSQHYESVGFTESGQVAFRRSYQTKSNKVIEYRPTKILGTKELNTKKHKYVTYETALRWAREEVSD